MTGTPPTLRSSLREHLDLARELRYLEIRFDAEKCKGTWQCYEVCPVGCWTPSKPLRVVEFHNPELCVACGACVLQCPETAIELS